MGIGVYTDFKVYNEFYRLGYVETIAQKLFEFGAPTMNAFKLEAELIKGHYKYSSFFNRIGSLSSRRVGGTVSAQTATALTQEEFISVKLDRKINAVQSTADEWKKLGADPIEMSYRVGEMAAADRVQEYINTSISAVVAALANQATNYLTVCSASTTTMTATNLNNGFIKLGDHANDIRVLVMHSKVYNDIVNQAIADKIYEEAGRVVYGGMPGTMGRPVLITDSDSLVTTDGTNVAYYTLALTENAVIVTESEPDSILWAPVPALENIVWSFQSEYAYNLGLKGFKWDVANGGINPTGAALATGSNWDMAVTSYKNLGGICIKSL